MMILNLESEFHSILIAYLTVCYRNKILLSILYLEMGDMSSLKPSCDALSSRKKRLRLFVVDPLFR